MRTPHMRHRVGMLAICAALAATAAQPRAHDFWIEPTTFTPAAGRIVGVRLRVGQDFVGDPVARDPARIEQFVAAGRSATTNVPGQEGADPAGVVRLDGGLLVLGYRSTPSPIVLPSDTFDRYLREEGLEEVARTRSRLGQAAQPAHELFSRCAKSLLQAGPPNPRDRDRALGMELELVAMRNPYALHVGDSLDVRLLYRGRPLRGALVVAMPKRDATTRVRARTGPDGRVRLPLRAAGPWLVKAVHMVPTGTALREVREPREPSQRQSGAEWRSYWASLTFELADPASAGTR